MQIDLAHAIDADIFAYEDGKPYVGRTWPSDAGVAIILCPDCGEIDETGEFFEQNTVYSNLDNCIGCKCQGFMLVGI